MSVMMWAKHTVFRWNGSSNVSIRKSVDQIFRTFWLADIPNTFSNGVKLFRRVTLSFCCTNVTALI